MDKKVIQICGESNLIPDFEAIGNNPNYVFESDPQFETIILYNSEGTVINVNSWLECANYVNGGWETKLMNLVNYEKYLFFGLIIFCTAYILIDYYVRKVRTVEK